MAASGSAAVGTLAARAGDVSADRPRRRLAWDRWLTHLILASAVALIAFPLYYAFVISTQTISEASSLPPRLLPSGHFLENYAAAWQRASMSRLLFNSAVMALAVAIGKILISILSAFAIVYFDFRGKTFAFFESFGIVHAVTQGGPGDATSLLVYKAWKDGFQGLELGFRPPSR